MPGLGGTPVMQTPIANFFAGERDNRDARLRNRRDRQLNQESILADADIRNRSDAVRGRVEAGYQDELGRTNLDIRGAAGADGAPPQAGLSVDTGTPANSAVEAATETPVQEETPQPPRPGINPGLWGLAGPAGVATMATLSHLTRRPGGLPTGDPESPRYNAAITREISNTVNNVYSSNMYDGGTGASQYAAVFRDVASALPEGRLEEHFQSLPPDEQGDALWSFSEDPLRYVEDNVVGAAPAEAPVEPEAPAQAPTQAPAETAAPTGGVQRHADADAATDVSPEAYNEAQRLRISDQYLANPEQIPFRVEQLMADRELLLARIDRASTEAMISGDSSEFNELTAQGTALENALVHAYGMEGLREFRELGDPRRLSGVVSMLTGEEVAYQPDESGMWSVVVNGERVAVRDPESIFNEARLEFDAAYAQSQMELAATAAEREASMLETALEVQGRLSVAQVNMLSQLYQQRLVNSQSELIVNDENSGLIIVRQPDGNLYRVTPTREGPNGTQIGGGLVLFEGSIAPGSSESLGFLGDIMGSGEGGGSQRGGLNFRGPGAQ